MSGVLSSSTTLGFQGLPQNSLNQRATMALFSCSFDMGAPSSLSLSAAPSVLEIKSFAALAHPIPAQVGFLFVRSALETSTTYDPHYGLSDRNPKESERCTSQDLSFPCP